MMCQEITTEPLKCPLNAQGGGDKSEAYRSFLNNVSAFRAMGTLPVLLNFEDVTVDKLVLNRGAWHKSCYVKFSKEKLGRAIKNETGMRLRRAVVVLWLNGFGASRWTKCPVCFVSKVMDIYMNLEHLKLQKD